MFKRLLIVTGVLIAGFSSAALIPKEPEIQAAAVRMELPDEAAGWTGVPREPTPEELEALAADTEFEKREYFRFRPMVWHEALEAVNVSIVLSGHDLNNSIHRPERCLLAQGFKDLERTRLQLETDDGHSIPVRRVLSYREVVLPGESGEPHTVVRIPNITYYWFVGHGFETDSHYSRTLIDIRDRLLGGYNQRWAYFNVSSTVTEDLVEFGGRSEAETDRLLQDFVRDIYQACVKRDMLN